MALRDTSSSSSSSSLLLGLLLLLLLHTWGARAVEVNMEDRVKVMRGKTAQITCMFTSEEGVGGMIIQWFYVTPSGDKQRIYYHDPTIQFVEKDTAFTGRIGVNGTGAAGQVVLTITDVKLEDEVEFICLINFVTDGAGEGRTKLQVFESPSYPTIEATKEGISTEELEPSRIGTCEVKNGYPRPNITWYRNETPLRPTPGEVNIVPRTTMESSGLFSVTSELSMLVQKQHKDDLFYCEVNYFVPEGTRMMETKRINITVYYPSTAVSLWVESPKGKIKEKDSIEFHCQGNGNKPSSIYSITAPDDKELTVENNVVVLENVTRLHNGVYTCTVTDTDNFEVVTGNTTVVVNFLDSATVFSESSVFEQGEEMNASCNALSPLKTRTVWLKDGVEVSEGHTLRRVANSFDDAGMYECVVTVPEIEGMITRTTHYFYVQGKPEVLPPPNKVFDESVGSTVTLTCHARGFPVPDVVWTDSDKKVLTGSTQKDMADGVESTISFEVSADITALCTASNDYGTAMETFEIRAIKYTTATTTTTTTSTTTTTTSATITNETSNETSNETPNETPTAISSVTVKAETASPPKNLKKESSGVIIAVLIICILLLAILGSVLYFLYKKGKICGRSGKQDLTKEKSNKDNIVVEMKSDTEEAVLLGVNGEKQPPSPQ